VAQDKNTILTLQAQKRRGEPITMITAYDYPGAIAAERAGIDSILVGDSLAMVVLGYESTVSVTMEEMLHHCRAVRRGANRAFLIGDLPFMSYQADVTEAVRNAGRFLKEAGMDAVKLEGGTEVCDTVRAISRAGITVVGHIGLTPQSAAKLGGYRVQGRTAKGAESLLESALALEQSGAAMLVLEMVPDRVAQIISQRLTVPTIGIGAGSGCDGQVLVMHDMLGMFDRFTPRFVRRYAEVHTEMEAALKAYAAEVQARAFPTAEHSFQIDDAEFESWQRESSAQ
jgi:3-methyl-2-oxobutanoate hydroxymethyltransferase